MHWHCRTFTKQRSISHRLHIYTNCNSYIAIKYSHKNPGQIFQARAILSLARASPNKRLWTSAYGSFIFFGARVDYTRLVYTHVLALRFLQPTLYVYIVFLLNMCVRLSLRFFEFCLVGISAQISYNYVLSVSRWFSSIFDLPRGVQYSFLIAYSTFQFVCHNNASDRYKHSIHNDHLVQQSHRLLAR